MMRGGDAQHPFLLPNFFPAFGARGCLRAAGQSPGSVGGVSPSSPAVPLGCSPCSCVAPQALPGVRVNKLISTKPWLWCGSVGLGTGSAPPSCCPLGLDQVRGSRVCAPGAPRPAPCTQQTPQNNFWGLHKDVLSVLSAAPLPLPAALFPSQRAACGAGGTSCSAQAAEEEQEGDGCACPALSGPQMGSVFPDLLFPRGNNKTT